VLGIDPTTTTGDIAQALYEAIAFELRLCLESLGYELDRPLAVTGGGSAIRPWLQAIADVLDVSVRRLRVRDASAWGAALLPLYGSAVASRLLRHAFSRNLVTPRGNRSETEIAYARYRHASALANSYYETEA
jgi:xylulokinase